MVFPAACGRRTNERPEGNCGLCCGAGREENCRRTGARPDGNGRLQGIEAVIWLLLHWLQLVPFFVRQAPKRLLVGWLPCLHWALGIGAAMVQSADDEAEKSLETEADEGACAKCGATQEE